MDKRIAGYDFIRSISILIVFIYHIVDKQTTSKLLLLVFHSLSPGLTMSLLGFISAALLSAKEPRYSTFILRRFTRVYISLFICLLLVLCAHAVIGKLVVTQHILFHFMGLSDFFDLFHVQNKATIGQGLWFITAIMIMYFLLPSLQTLFLHPRGKIHVVTLVFAFTALNLILYGTGSLGSSWNVAISFTIGVYLEVNNKIKELINTRTSLFLTGSLGVLVVAALATAHVLPYSMRSLLYGLYPLAFVPLLFAIARKCSRRILVASTFFSSLSFEFYILHFYFINEGLQGFFPIRAGLMTQIIISFVVTFLLAYATSRLAARLRRMIDGYLLLN